MSTASLVPETREIDDRVPGRGPRAVLERQSTRRFVGDTVDRLRAADGFSHSRATAFQTVLALIPGSIVLVAVAAELRWSALTSAVVTAVSSVAPGPASDVFEEAFQQGSRSGPAALVSGFIALLVAGTTAFGQVERLANRIYGIETDRPSVSKYGHAFVRLLTAGVLVTLFVLLAGLGGGWEIAGTAWRLVWNVARWVVGGAVLVAALMIVLRTSPRRRQPTTAWLVPGALVGTALTLAGTALLQVFLIGSRSFGETYGPLAGFLGVLLWAYANCLALAVAISVTAQLEAARAGVTTTRSTEKVEAGEPDATAVPYATAMWDGPTGAAGSVRTAVTGTDPPRHGEA